MRRRGTIFRIVVAALALLMTATAASAAVRATIGEPLAAAKPQGWVLLVTGVIVVGLIAWRRFSAEHLTDD
jgi:hypothetical protein